MHAPTVIATKRDGGTIDGDTLRAFLDAYLDGEVADEQMAAFLMAGVLNGFSEDEAFTMADAMVASGDVVDLGSLAGPTVDKHSTGGVGDSCTLVVAPVLAACGAQVAKLSGRGLGHTGGTLDKLESIPGFAVDRTIEQVRDQVERIGLAVVAATGDLVPLDKRLYALRDVTATVPSPALVAASVMSKKIAGGAEHIVLDVKVGDGAFMETVDQAVALACLCVRIGEQAGRRVAALVTDMSQPLAPAVGNALEVAAAVDVLTGAAHGRFRTLCEELAVEALVLTGRERGDAERDVVAALDDGTAAERFRDLVVAQDGEPDVVDDARGVLPAAPVVMTWEAPTAGTVAGLACERLGLLAGRLGAGRRRKEDDVDPAVGLEVLAAVGEAVEAGQPLVRVHARDDDAAAAAVQELDELVTIGEAEAVPLVHTRVGPDPDDVGPDHHGEGRRR